MLLENDLGGGRYRTRTYDLVRVKQGRSKTAVDCGGICQSFWTFGDRTKPQEDSRPPPNRPQECNPTDSINSVVVLVRIVQRSCIDAAVLGRVQGLRCASPPAGATAPGPGLRAAALLFLGSRPGVSTSAPLRGGPSCGPRPEIGLHHGVTEE